MAASFRIGAVIALSTCLTIQSAEKLTLNQAEQAYREAREQFEATKDISESSIAIMVRDQARKACQIAREQLITLINEILEDNRPLVGTIVGPHGVDPIELKKNQSAWLEKVLKREAAFTFAGQHRLYECSKLLVTNIAWTRYTVGSLGPPLPAYDALLAIGKPATDAIIKRLQTKASEYHDVFVISKQETKHEHKADLQPSIQRYEAFLCLAILIEFHGKAGARELLKDDENLAAARTLFEKNRDHRAIRRTRSSE